MQDLVKQQQFEKMTKTKVSRLILKLAIPNIVSMVINSVYNMIDTLFVAQTGTSAAAAVGIVLSVMTIIQAIGFMLGQGAGSVISIFLGQKEYKKASVYATTAFMLSFVFGIILTILGLLFLKDFMEILGATPTILPYAEDFAFFILLGAPIAAAMYVLNNLLRYQGLAALSMVGLTVGAVINTICDPILIFGAHLGIKGAAISTFGSQTISFFILLAFMMFSKKNILKLRLKYISKNFSDYVVIMKTGFPSFCRQALTSVGTIALNLSASFYGDAAVAAMSIVNRIFMLLISTMFGFLQGYQPVAGSNFGAQRFTRLRESFRFCLILGTIILTVLGTLGFIFAPYIIMLFRADDTAVISIGSMACRAQCISMPLQTLIAISNMTFQVIGKSKEATFLSSLRQGIYFFPLILLLPHFFGLFGIEITQAISDVLSSLTCIPFLYILFKRMPKKDYFPELGKGYGNV